MKLNTSISTFLFLFLLTFFATDAIGQQKKKANKPNKGSRSHDSQWQTHNSMNLLDWTIVYRFNLPCADCYAIQTLASPIGR